MNEIPDEGAEPEKTKAELQAENQQLKARVHQLEAENATLKLKVLDFEAKQRAAPTPRITVPPRRFRPDQQDGI